MSLLRALAKRWQIIHPHPSPLHLHIPTVTTELAAVQETLFTIQVIALVPLLMVGALAPLALPQGMVNVMEQCLTVNV